MVKGKAASRAERPENQQFARNLHLAMTEKGFSNSDLARALWGETEDNKGYKVAKNRDRIAVYLRGEGLPTPATLHKIATILGVAKEDLLPAVTTAAIDRDRPEFAMKMLGGGDDKVHLQINAVVPFAVAVQITRLYEQSKKGNELTGGTDEGTRAD